jgi:hypothetical protein
LLNGDTEIIVTDKDKAKRDDVRCSHDFPTIFFPTAGFSLSLYKSKVLTIIMCHRENELTNFKELSKTPGL